MEAPRRLSTPYQVRIKSVSITMEKVRRNYGEDTDRIRRSYGDSTEKIRKKPSLTQKLYKFLCPLA